MLAQTLEEVGLNLSNTNFIVEVKPVESEYPVEFGVHALDRLDAQLCAMKRYNLTSLQTNRIKKVEQVSKMPHGFSIYLLSSNFEEAVNNGMIEMEGKASCLIE